MREQVEQKACPHPAASWRRPDGSCYVCWCERQARERDRYREALEELADHYDEAVSDRAREALGAQARPSGVELGADFPLTDEQKMTREQIGERLQNALYGVYHDPIGGNIRHNVLTALNLMDEADEWAHEDGPHRATGPHKATDLGYMLSCCGVHPEAVRIVEGLQAEVGRLRDALRKVAHPVHPARTEEAALVQIEVKQIAQAALDA